MKSPRINATFEALLQHDTLSPADERAMFTHYAKLRDIWGADHRLTVSVRNQIARRYMRFVVHVAKRFRGDTLEDRVADGSFGLLEAIDRFDAQLGWRFQTYAYHRIRFAINRARENGGRVVRVPVHRQAKLRSGSFESSGVLLDGAPLSFDAPLNEDGATFYDVISAESADVVDQISLFHLSDDVRRLVLGCLPKKHREIIERRFGLRNDNQETLETIGTRFGVSRERIRQLEAEALDMLRDAMRHERKAG